MDDPQSTAAPALIGCQGLEQFLLLTKTARGPAAVELIQRVLEAPGVYVFGELLETECVKELAGGANASYFQLLELFAYGTYNEYKRKIFWNWWSNFDVKIIFFFVEQMDSLPKLTPLQLKKLKHLTIVSLAAKNRVSVIHQLWNWNEITANSHSDFPCSQFHTPRYNKS